MQLKKASSNVYRKAATLALVGIGAYEDFDFVASVLGDRELTHPVHENAKRYAKIQKDFARVMQMSGELGKA